jgi:hypothetical protein
MYRYMQRELKVFSFTVSALTGLYSAVLTEDFLIAANNMSEYLYMYLIKKQLFESGAKLTVFF